MQLTQAIEDLGGSLDASGDVEYAEVRGTALGRNWETLLTLIAEVALRPTFPSEEIERERRLILSAIQTRGDTPFQRAFDAMLTDLYGRHGYGWPNLGTRESLARLDRAALASTLRDDLSSRPHGAGRQRPGPARSRDPRGGAALPRHADGGRGEALGAHPASRPARRGVWWSGRPSRRR